MPRPTFFPDDGPILLLPRPSLREAGPDYAKVLGGRRGQALFFEDRLIEINTQFYRRTWQSGGIPPTWESLELQSFDGLMEHKTNSPEDRFALTVRSKTRIEAGVVEDITTFSQTRWRYAWRTLDPGLQGAWNFAHLRWSASVWLWEAPNSPPEEPLQTSGAFDQWWKPDPADPDPAGYHLGDPLSWPGTDWVTEEVAEQPSVPDPDTGTLTSYSWRGLKLLWGRNTPSLAFPYEGRIPGGVNDSTPYRHPKVATGFLI